MLAVPSVPIEKDQVRSHAILGVFVDSEQPLHGGPSSAFCHRIELSNFEGGLHRLRCTGWCMPFSPGPLRGGLPNSAPFLDFTHLRS
jgi:hypothetical protein